MTTNPNTFVSRQGAYLKSHFNVKSHNLAYSVKQESGNTNSLATLGAGGGANLVTPYSRVMYKYFKPGVESWMQLKKEKKNSLTSS